MKFSELGKDCFSTRNSDTTFRLDLEIEYLSIRQQHEKVTVTHSDIFDGQVIQDQSITSSTDAQT